MSIIPQLIANGIIAGSIYALVALGLTLIFGILRFIHFAHGEVFMLGAYFAWTLAIKYGFPLWLALILSIIGCGLIGYIIEKIAFKPLRYTSRLAPLITAIALSIFLQALAILIWGAQIRTFRTREIEQGMPIAGAIVTKIQLIIIITTIVLMFALHLFVKHTKTGKAMRAAADNIELASVIGINLNRTISIVFILGSMLAAIAGVLVGIEQNLTPTMGVAVTIKAFTATIVGGVGNIYGAFLGGYVIGLVENIGIWYLPSGYKDAIAFVILLLMLLFKPTGILGRKTEEDIRQTSQ